MTRTLDAAVARLVSLSADDQDRVGRWLLYELADDRRLSRQFEGSQDELGTLAVEVRGEHTRGRTTDSNSTSRDIARLSETP